MTHGISCLPQSGLRCHAQIQGLGSRKCVVAFSETPALPAGQRAGLPSSRPGARTYSSQSLTDHAGSTTTPVLLGRSGNAATGAEGRKPGSTVETAGASVPAFFGTTCQ